jgi:hypothetical protein
MNDDHFVYSMIALVVVFVICAIGERMKSIHDAAATLPRRRDFPVVLSAVYAYMILHANWSDHVASVFAAVAFFLFFLVRNVEYAIERSKGGPT